MREEHEAVERYTVVRVCGGRERAREIDQETASGEIEKRTA